jgi:RHS repeat-associated protein
LFWSPISSYRVRAEDDPPTGVTTAATPEMESSQPFSVREAIADTNYRVGSLEEKFDVSGSRLAHERIDVERIKEALEGATEGVEAEGAPPEEPEQDAQIPFNLPTGPSKTAVTPQQIALPKGEGSIEGMGESFTPNLSSGTGTFSVPIAVPKGRAGVQPGLSLSYATSGGNGIVGFGWSMALPFISRQTDKGLPRYVDSASWTTREDTFMYNGGQELVPVANAAATRIDEAPVPAEFAGWQQYRARIEGGFMRFFRAPDASRWVVQSKDGSRFEFGACNGSSSAACAGAAVQADPEDGSKIFSWNLVRMSDVHGSTVHYSYTSNSGILYPAEIFYTSPASCSVFESAGATRDCSAPFSSYAHRIAFVYEGRSDVTSSYLTGWRTEQGFRLKRIELTSAGNQAGARFLVRRYHLRYETGSYHSLLSTVQVEGRPSTFDPALGVEIGDAFIPEGTLSDRVVGHLLPPMSFAYTAAQRSGEQVSGFGGIDTTVHYSGSSPDHSADEGRADLFDVNADGLPDLLVTDPARYGGGAGVYFNGFSRGFASRAGDFDAGVTIGVPSGLGNTLNLASLNVLPMDIDGDGRTDVLHMPRTANYGYFVLSKEPTVAGAFYKPTKGWSFHHVTDLLPQGVTDPRIDLGKDSASIKTLDVNNDHLIDIMRSTGSELQTWLNLGRYPDGEGRFGSAESTTTGFVLSTAPITSCLPYAGRNLDLSDERVRIADMNGDGLQDIVHIAPDEVYWWPGRGPGVWGDGSQACDDRTRAGREIRMENPPRELNGELAGLQLLDVNADGTTDLVYVGFSELSVWFNRGGASFTERLVADGTPYAVDALDRIRVADVDGTGTTDILFADSGRWRWLDLMGGVRPRLLQSVDNGLGALTTLTYSSSIVDYLRDLSEATRCDPTRLECFTWQREPRKPDEAIGACDATVLEKSGTCVHRSGGSPVVSTVVRKVSTSDRMQAIGALETKTETEYTYHDGYYEGIEQEFRGFGAADARVIGDAHEPTSRTRTHFHQGRRPNDISAERLADNPNEALKGREFLTEISDETGTYLNTKHAAYAVRSLLTGLNGVRVSYAYVTASSEYRYDTPAAGQRAWTPQSKASVRREATTGGLLGIVSAVAQAGDAPHLLAIRHEDFVMLRSTTDLVDNAGNMRKQTAWGRGGRGEYSQGVVDESITSRTDPMLIDDSACGNTGWLWRTSQSWTEDATRAFRYGDTKNVYSSCGDLWYSNRFAQIVTNPLTFGGDAQAAALTQSNGAYEFSSSAIDGWGQARVLCGGAKITDANGLYCLRRTQITFDPAYDTLPIQEAIAVDGPASDLNYLTTTATWDRGLAALTSATDPNGYKSEVFYDGLGRLTATVVPNVLGCVGSRVPSTRVQYDVTQTPVSRPLSRVTTRQILSCANSDEPQNQLVSYAYVDGLGRSRASIVEGDAASAAWADDLPHPYTKSGLALFTKKGQPRESFQTDFFDGSPNDYVAVMLQPTTPSTRNVFDAFGRPVLSVNEDGTYKSISYHALSTDVCDEADNGAMCAGEQDFTKTCTTERTDGHGRAIDQHLRQVTANGTREHHRLFTYYRADGIVTRIVRALTPSNFLRPDTGYGGMTRYVERRFNVDTLGRRVASDDPDTDDRAQASFALRTWRYLYNSAGDLVAVRDPRGCGQNFYYDLVGRMIGEAYVGCAESQRGELPVATVPTGSVSLARTASETPVHVRNYFDSYPSWANSLLPATVAGVLGRSTANQDRSQRSAVAYDPRGNVVWGARQVALSTVPATLTGALLLDGRPTFDTASEAATADSPVIYDSAHTYERTATFDHAGRVTESGYPTDPNFEDGTAPVILGRLFYHDMGLPERAELCIDSISKPVIANIAYTRDGLTATTTYGDEDFTGRAATSSTTVFDARRRPIEQRTVRTPAPESTGLSAVSLLQDQRLSWDGAGNLCRTDDRRSASDWPEGHKPYSQDIFHDALYRVTSVYYDYKTTTFDDAATDWRTEEDRRRESDPMKADAAEMVATLAPKRVEELQYSHDFLANMTSWTDDARVFYERSVGGIVNGQDLTPNNPSPGLRPSALYLATDLLPASMTPEQVDRGGWVETDYGQGGNLLALTVHGQCGHATTNSCVDPSGTNLLTRRTALRTGCDCAVEQHYVYRWDELNRLHEARRYDGEDGTWELAARQRYRYDGANQRIIKQTLGVGDHAGTERTALYVYPGDFERRGLVNDGDSWEPALDGRSETQYLVAGARVVWQHRTHGIALDADQRVTFAVTNLIQSTSAVIDLTTGEIVEVSGYYPNGAREEALGASEALGGGGIPFEVSGFTGKEADEEVGLTYFGERYLVQRLGRWATPDPLSVHAAGGGEALNGYHYVSGNLLQARDPLGLYGDREGSSQDEAVTQGVSGEKQTATADQSHASSEFTPAAPPLGTGGEGGWGENFDWAVAREGKSETWLSKPKGSDESEWRRASGFSSWSSGGERSADRAQAVNDIDYVVDFVGAAPALAKAVASVCLKQVGETTTANVLKSIGDDAADAVLRQTVTEGAEGVGKSAARGGGGGGKAFSAEKKALVDMAKADKKAGGITPRDMDAYKDLNRGLSDPFPKNQVRGPEAHSLRTPQSTPGPGQLPHGHVGPVDHIPIIEVLP